MFKKVAVVCISVFITASVHAADIYVNPGQSIQGAINFASPGDTIVLGEGTFVENITIPNSKTGLSIVGQGSDDTTIVSDGGDVNPKNAPATVPADIIIDIFAANVTISDLSVVHPEGETLKRDIGIFFRPPAVNGMVSNCEIERERTGFLEPTRPGSRGNTTIVKASASPPANNSHVPPARNQPAPKALPCPGYPGRSPASTASDWERLHSDPSAGAVARAKRF